MKNLFPYIYDFLSLMFENKEIRNRVKNIVLFGSVAAGESDEESDIDLFIETWSKNSIKEIEASVKESEKRFLSVSKKWSLIGIRQPIKCIVGVLNDPRWKELRHEMISNGIVLYGKFEEPEEGLKHYTMFNYSLTKLNQNKKMDFLRKLFGYKAVKAKKVYKRSGFLDEIGGIKLASNVILVPVENSRKAHKFLTSYRITPEIREIRIR